MPAEIGRSWRTVQTVQLCPDDDNSAGRTRRKLIRNPDIPQTEEADFCYYVPQVSGFIRYSTHYFYKSHLSQVRCYDFS